MLIAFTIWTACSAVYAKTGNSGAGSAVLAMIFVFYGGKSEKFLQFKIQALTNHSCRFRVARSHCLIYR